MALYYVGTGIDRVNFWTRRGRKKIRDDMKRREERLAGKAKR